MDIPKYWAKAEQSVTIRQQQYHFVAWKGSDESLDAARVLAEHALQERIARKERNEKLGRYPEGSAPLREEIIKEVMGMGQQRIAVITRNAAGCLVLNTAKVMFIDLDLVNRPMALQSMLRNIINFFRGKKATPKFSAADEVLKHIHDWHKQHEQWAVRVYRTKRGFRLLVVHDLFDPKDVALQTMMRSLGADERYIRLCAAQACFRARLTPKPWRIKLERPPVRYPWETAEQELLQREWEISYHQKIEAYSVCQLVESLGPADAHPDAAIIQNLHDQYVLKGSSKPVA